MSPAPPGDGEFLIERREVRRAFGRAAADYDAAAELQQRVRGELLERLDLVRIEPAAVLDLGTGTGHAALALKRRYPKAQVVALDLAESMLREAGRRQTLLRRFRRVCADAACAAVPAGQLRHRLQQPDAAVVRRPGPGLRRVPPGAPAGRAAHLRELRSRHAASSFAAPGRPSDDHVHVSRFIDMHDLGDALLRAGSRRTGDGRRATRLTYAEVRDLMLDLKAIGAHNASAGRPRGLTGKGTLARMIAAYESFRRDGRLPATYEVVFGHAWAPVTEPRPQRPADRGDAGPAEPDRAAPRARCTEPGRLGDMLYN